MNYWVFKVFIKDSGQNVIKKWLKKYPLDIKAGIERRFRYLRTLATWDKRPHSAKRKGSDYIYEIIIKLRGNQYRPLGFFGPNDGEFTLLIGAVEKDQGLEPKDAQENAELY